MSTKVILAVICTLCLTYVTSEPPSSQYGTPLGTPLSSYGTPNEQANHHDHGHEYEGEPKAYEFGYQVKDEYSGNDYNRKEQSDGNQVRGEYRVALPDGRTQIVTYYADWQTGFHADVRYEGEAHYPEQYNKNQGGYNNGPSSQYGTPEFNQNAHNLNNAYSNGGGGSAVSSVNIKDFSQEGQHQQNGGDYNNNNGYDNGFANVHRPSTEYGAP